ASLTTLPLAPPLLSRLSFFFRDRPPPAPSSLPLHDALPICPAPAAGRCQQGHPAARRAGRRHRARHHGPPEPVAAGPPGLRVPRSEEHTSELQSLTNLVCRLLLEKKKATVLHRVGTLLPLTL